MKNNSVVQGGLLAVLGASLCVNSANAASAPTTHTFVVDGPDAIFLAGRTDLTIPAAGVAWTGPGDHLIRHPLTEALEQFPDFIAIEGGDIIRALDPAIGGVNFFPGPSAGGFFGPGGNGINGSTLNPLGGISGYKGPEGPLVGVFLSDAVPNGSAVGTPPPTIDYSLPGAIDQLINAPLLNQIFYIGDGKAGTEFQQFIAPAGATRLFLGIPDGFGFDGAPGAYDDNNGSYTVAIGVNQVPTGVPDGGAVLPVLAAVLGGLAFAHRRVTQKV